MYISLANDQCRGKNIHSVINAQYGIHKTLLENQCPE